MATDVRLAELVSSLSLATDLGLGLPQEHILRQTVIATRLAKAAGLSDDEQAAGFYVSLLAWVGCIADAHELARWYDDELEVRADSYHVDKAGMSMMRFVFGHIGASSPPWQRLTVIGRFLSGGMKDAMNSFVTHCQATGDIAERLGLTDDVRAALSYSFERWDGKGSPDGVRGDAIPPVMRVVQIADDSEVLCRMGGIDAAVTMLQSRAGTEFDPQLVEVCTERAPDIFGDLDTVDAWDVVIEGCRPLDRRVTEDELTSILEVFADYGDLKSTFFLGHTHAMASLAAEAARRQGLPAEDVTLVHRAALVSRLGVTGVSTNTWDKPGALTSFEWERVRTVPYITERALARSARLAELGAVAGMMHERINGSGYPRGLSGASISQHARILAAAEMYQAMNEDRPHRAALSHAERGSALADEAAAGRLDSKAVHAVLEAAGHQPRRRANLVAGLTSREAEVLAMLVRGRTNKQIAQELSITPRTVGSHVEHIYNKIGVTTRGSAAMFAMRHGLVDVSAIREDTAANIGRSPDVTPGPRRIEMAP